MRKIICALLLAVCLPLAACAADIPDTSEPDRSDDESKAGTISVPLDVLPDMEYNQSEFVIWTTEPSVVTENDAVASSISKVFAERTDELENKFDVAISAVVMSKSEILSSLRSGKAAGTDGCDLILMPSDSAGTAAAEGCLVNMWSLPYFSAAAKSLDGLAEEQTINNSLYMLASNDSFAAQNAVSVYYNRDIISKNGLKDPYYAVINGTWTVDLMLEYIKACSTVADKRSPDIKTDIFGFTCEGLDYTDLINSVWNGSGIEYFGTTMGRPIYAEFDESRGKAATAAAKALIDSNTLLYDKSVNGSDVFLSGRVVFCLTVFNRYLTDGSLNGMNWGIAPMPKTESGQEGYSCMLPEALCLCVPAGTADSERAGLLLSGWIIASGEAEDALLKFYITYCSTDNMNTVMMQTVFDSVQFTKTELYSGIYRINEVGRKLIAASVTDGIDLLKYIRWQDSYVTAAMEKFK